LFYRLVSKDPRFASSSRLAIVTRTITNSKLASSLSIINPSSIDGTMDLVRSNSITKPSFTSSNIANIPKLALSPRINSTSSSNSDYP